MTTEKTRTLKPGILVALSTRISGGVSYSRVDIERGSELDNGAQRERWETTKTVEDPEELARATKVRSTISSMIRRLCIETAFGLICTKANEPALDEVIKRARTLAAEHNGGAPASRVALYVLKGEIASTDEEAARAIGEEVKDLIDAMSAGIDAADPQAIRDAADRARKLGSVLDVAQEIAVSEAVAQARKAARTIVSRVEKKLEDSADVIKSIQRGAIERARLAFLDIDPIEATATEQALPAVDVSRLAELDLEGAHETQDTDAPESSPSDESIDALVRSEASALGLEVREVN